MIATALLGLIQSILYSMLLFYLGRMLSNSKQLRNYLGMRVSDEQESEYGIAAYWIEKIGSILTLIALINALIAIYTTFTILADA